MESNTRSELTAALDRHESRRESGLPTVSVLSGPVVLGLREGRLWAEGRNRPVVEVDDPRPLVVADAWSDRLAAGCDLRRLVVARLARRLGEGAVDLEGRVARMSSPELGLFLEVALADPDGDPAEAACRWILREAGGGGLAAPGLAGRLGRALPDRAGVEPALRALAALQALTPPGSDPVILASGGPGGAGDPARVDAAARSLACLALARPRLTVILAAETGDLEHVLRDAPESREKALIRSGLVTLPALREGEIRRRLNAATPGPAPAAARDGLIRRLAEDGASDRLVGRLVEAVAAEPAAGAEDVGDRARSAAERFLFERLESLPATAGLFAMNSTLDIPFGPGRAMEVDFASHALRLAIEVDGYHHFRGEDEYRRDRRKDFLLQSRGYLVVRVLAEDVVRRLEDVLDLVLEAVALRRREGNAPNRDPRP